MTAAVASLVGTALLLAAVGRGGARFVRGTAPGRRSSLLFLAFATALSIVPVAGHPVHRWCATFYPILGAPLAALLFDVTWSGATGRPLFRDADRRAFWAFGSAAGLFLYPMSLGLGPFDPYALGWSFSWLFPWIGTVAAVLILRGNRFGYALLLALAAWHGGLLESTNLWDYVVDPAYFLLSVGALSGRAFRRAAPAAPLSPSRFARREPE